MELEELKRLREVDVAGILSRVVEPLGTELDIVRAELNAMRILRIGERVIELPGLSRNMDLITAVVAEYKDAKKRNVLPLQFAKSDDIVVMPIRLEHIAADIVDEQDVTIAAGEYTDDFHILPRTTGTFDITTAYPFGARFIFTDFIELYSPVSCTGIRIVDADGIDQYPLDATLAFKATDLQIFELPHLVIADTTFDIDGKVESKVAGQTVTTAVKALGVWVGIGKDVPPLFKQ